MTTQLQDSLEATIMRYCEAFPIQIRSLLRFLLESERNRDLQTAIRDTRAELHRMAGAAHCLGYRQVGLKIGKLEKRLNDLSGKNRDVIERQLAPIIGKLEDLLELQSGLVPENSRLLMHLVADPTETANQTDRLLDLAREEARTRMMSKERILIAEDDPYIRDMMRSTLREMGVESLRVAASGFEVLKIINEYQPTFIISDWEMEPVSGLELLRCIRRGGTDLPNDTPVVFFTTHKDRPSATLAGRNGVNKLIGKPVLPETLRDAVLSVVERRFYLTKHGKHAA